MKSGLGYYFIAAKSRICSVPSVITSCRKPAVYTSAISGWNFGLAWQVGVRGGVLDES